MYGKPSTHFFGTNYPIPEVAVEVQEFIKLHIDSEYYNEKYSKDEVKHWGPVLSWMIMVSGLKKTEKQLRILDVGCGYGTLLGIAHNLGFETYGIDFLPMGTYLSEETHKKYAIHFEQCNLEASPLPFSGPFDVVLLTDVLEHLNFQPATLLAKIRDVLKPDGCLMVTTPALGHGWQPEIHDMPFEEIPEYSPDVEYQDRHMKIYSVEELKRLFESTGFKAYVGVHNMPGSHQGELHAFASPK